MGRGRLISTALATGVALGVVTKLADNQENALTWLGSLTAPWVIASFALGSLARNYLNGVLCATGAMVLGVATYYAWMRLFEGGVNLSYFLSTAMLWLLLAPVAGIVFGLAGSAWRKRANAWVVRAATVALVAGVIAGETGFMAATARDLTAGEGIILGGFMLLGISLPGALLDGARERIAGYLLSGVCLLLGVATIPVIRYLVTMV